MPEPTARSRNGKMFQMEHNDQMSGSFPLSTAPPVTDSRILSTVIDNKIKEKDGQLEELAKINNELII